MITETDYEITYTISRRLPGDDDFVEIGFGSSGGWDNPAQCAHMIASAIDNYEWETNLAHPDPEHVKASVEATA